LLLLVLLLCMLQHEQLQVQLHNPSTARNFGSSNEYMYIPPTSTPMYCVYVLLLLLLLLRFAAAAAAGAVAAESLQQSQLAHPAAVSWTRRLLQQGRTAHTIPSKDSDIPKGLPQHFQTLRSCKACKVFTFSLHKC